MPVTPRLVRTREPPYYSRSVVEISSQIAGKRIKKSQQFKILASPVLTKPSEQFVQLSFYSQCFAAQFSLFHNLLLFLVPS